MEDGTNETGSGPVSSEAQGGQSCAHKVILAIVISLAFLGGIATAAFYYLGMGGDEPVVQNEAAVIESKGVIEEPVPDTVRPGHVLVKFAPGVERAAQQALISRIGGEEVDRIKGIELALIKVPEHAQDALIAGLNKNPNIEFAEADVLQAPLYAPNDPGLSQQWYHLATAAPDAWDIYNGINGVTIAIADTGLYTAHEDIANSVVGTYNAVDGTTNVTDENGHGTKVAGVAAGIGNNGVGIAGVSYASPIYSIKVSNLSTGSAYTSDLAKAIQYAADNNIRVINLSYDACDSSSIRTAADYMETKGGLVFLGAGNNGQQEAYAAASSLICLSATDANDSLTSWSSYGDHVDFAMPGSAIYTTTNTGGYGSVSGTSFSSPMMAGAAAVLLSVNPSLTPVEVKEIFKQTAKDLGEPGWDMRYGWGIVDLGAAVAMASSGAAVLPDPELPVVTITSPQEGDTISGSFEMAVEASDNSGIVSKVDMSLIAVDPSGGFISGGSTDQIEPYTSFFHTSGIPNGQYILEAIATDGAGNESLPARITIEVLNSDDAEAPVVTVLSPNEGEVLPSRGSFTISAEASDNVGVEQMILLFDGSVYATCSKTTTCEASVSLKGVDAGAHTIMVSALDAKNNRTNETISVTVGSKGGGKTDSGDDSTGGGSTGGGSTNGKGKKK